MAQENFNFRGTLPAGSKVETITIKGKEDPAERRLRLRIEFWSFVVKDLAAYLVSYPFLIGIGVFCCYLVVRHGVQSAEAKTVLPLLTTLFGGVVGLIIGRASKSA